MKTIKDILQPKDIVEINSIQYKCVSSKHSGDCNGCAFEYKSCDSIKCYQHNIILLKLSNIKT